MIKTHDMLMQELDSYGAPGNKIMRMVGSGELLPLTRGVYETDPAAPAIALAACIYGPSYVSFETALARFGLIPERVAVVTSATFEKRRRKERRNAFGTYTFRDVPSEAFPLGLRVEVEQGRPFRIATPEKALCDQLCKAAPVGSMKELRETVFGSWRVDEEAFSALDKGLVAELAPRYRKANLRILREAIGKGKV